jgi:hypothetical protein
MAAMVRGRTASKVLAIESRGFILGSLVAERLGAGFVPVRKPGKLPARTRKASYSLEYGTDSLEIHEDAVDPGERVLVVDDVIATGAPPGPWRWWQTGGRSLPMLLIEPDFLPVARALGLRRPEPHPLLTTPPPAHFVLTWRVEMRL